MSLTCEIKFVVQFYILPLPSRLRHATHRILNRRRKSGYLGYHLENSEDICTSHHKVLLPKVKEGAGEAGKIQYKTFLAKISYLCSTPVAGCEVRTMLNMFTPILLASLKSRCCLDLLYLISTSG